MSSLRRPISGFFPTSYCRYLHCRQSLLYVFTIFTISIILPYPKLFRRFLPLSHLSQIINPIHSPQPQYQPLNRSQRHLHHSHPPTHPHPTMCIPQIDIIPSPSPPPHRHPPKTPQNPLSVSSSSKPPSTNYITISPKIIYRAPPSSPKRSTLPPTHRRSSAPTTKYERASEVEFLGGYMAGRDAQVREQERLAEVERRRRAEERVAPPPLSPSAAVPSPLPPNQIQPASSPRLQQPPAPRENPLSHPGARYRHGSPSSSSSSSSSDSSGHSLRALRDRVNVLWDRVNVLEQWRGRERRRRSPWGKW